MFQRCPPAKNYSGSVFKQLANKKPSMSRAQPIVVRFNNVAVVISLLVICLITLFPLHFTLEVSKTGWNVLALSRGTDTYWQIVSNILLYCPFGFALASYCRLQQIKTRELLSIIVVSGFVLSYSCEVLQSFLPGRFPSWRDVGANTSGAILGSLCRVLWERNILLVVMAAYLICVAVLSIGMQRATTLLNWDTSFPLLVGNEHTGDRPWRGVVSEFYIGRKAASSREIRALLADKSPIPVLTEDLLSYYRRERAKGYRDDLGRSPPLAARGVPDSAADHELLWFGTIIAPHKIAEDLVKSSQFTVGAIISSASVNQHGPARILSFSEDVVRRNFTVGQEGQDLIVRLRTPLTGPNGVRPALRVPSVFSTLQSRHIIITYNGTNLSVYIDGVKSPESLKLTPALFVYNSVRQVDFPNSKPAELLYYGIIFVPAGILLLLAMLQAGRVRDQRMVGLLGGLISTVLSLGLEGLLVLASNRQVQVENIVMGVLFCYGSILVLYRLLARSLSFPIPLRGTLPQR